MATTPIPPRFLPRKPSAEYLRKQAKRLARSDAMQLAAAQRRLAHDYGYQNWAGLMTAVQAMASWKGGGSGANDSPPVGSYRMRESEPNIFPLLPLRGMVVFPHASYPVFVGRPMSINAVLHAKEHNIPILLATQRDAHVANVTSSDLFEVGTLATVVETLRLPDGTVKSIIEGKKRARLSRVSFDDDFSKAEADEIEEPTITDPWLEGLICSALPAFVREHVRAVSAWEKDPETTGVAAAAMILREGWSAIASVIAEPPKQANNASVLADKIASALRMELASQQALLETISPSERLEKLLAYLNALA